MCLNLAKVYKKRIAEKNIICYKHLRVDNYNNNSLLVTPYYKQVVQIGKTYTSIINILSWTISDRSRHCIAEALHSFKYKKNCKQNIYNMRVLNFIYQHEYVLAKCVIPKGSEYYVGRFGKSICYASDKLVYLELVSLDN